MGGLISLSGLTAASANSLIQFPRPCGSLNQVEVALQVFNGCPKNLFFYDFPHLILKKTKLQALPIKYRIRAMMQPLAQVDIPAAAIFQGPIDGQVPMAKNEVVGLDALLHFSVAIL